MGWITPIAFLLCHTYSIGDAATLETFSSKSVLSPERGALTGHFRKYLGFVCRAPSFSARGKEPRDNCGSCPCPGPSSGRRTFQTIVKLFGGQGTTNVNSWGPDSRR